MSDSPALDPADPVWVPICQSQALRDGGAAVGFELRHAGLCSRAFVVRFQGQVHAYLNRCTHVAMEMDWQPDRFFDATGQWLVCASHGAQYQPTTGDCVGGPCRKGLIKLRLLERDGVVHWLCEHPFSLLEF